MKKYIFILFVLSITPFEVFSQDHLQIFNRKTTGVGLRVANNSNDGDFYYVPGDKYFNIGITTDPLNFSPGANSIQYWHRGLGDGNNVYWAFTSNSNLVHGIVLAANVDATIYQGGIRMYFNTMRMWTGASQNTGYMELNGNTGQPTFSYFTTAGLLRTTTGGVVSVDTTVYASMGFADSSTTIAMTQNSYFHVTNATNDLYTESRSKNATVAGDSIVVGASGDYLILADLSYSGANTDNYHIALFVNNIEIPGFGETQRGMSGTDPGVVSSSTILALTNGDGVKVHIENTANNNDATIVAGNLTLSKLF